MRNLAWCGAHRGPEKAVCGCGSEAGSITDGAAGIARLRVASSQVSYIDSSGVAVLLLARQLCQQAGIGLHFDPPAESLFRVLELARLTDLLQLPPPLRPQDPVEPESLLPPDN